MYICMYISESKDIKDILWNNKDILPIKDILKTLPSSGINNYIKILQRQRSRKTAVKEMEWQNVIR